MFLLDIIGLGDARTFFHISFVWRLNVQAALLLGGRGFTIAVGDQSVWGWMRFGGISGSAVDLLPVVDLCIGKKSWIRSELWSWRETQGIGALG